MTESPSPAKRPPLPWKTRLLVAALSLVTDAARRSDGTVNRRLLAFLDDRTAPSATPSRGVRTADIPVDASREVWFRLFVPTDPTSYSPSGRRLPVIVFFHGGGFAFLSPASRSYDAVCRRISRKIPAILVSVNYRLSPEHRYPAPYEDGIDVLRFLDTGGLDSVDKRAAELCDLSSCFLVGDSAGANIVHNVAARWAAAASSWKMLRLSGIVLIQPFFGGEERTESEVRLARAPIVSVDRTDWLWRGFLPEGADRDHEAANVFGPRSAAVELAADFPPAMVVVGGFDPLQDWQKRYHEGLRARRKEAALVVYENSIHAFYVFPELKEAGLLIDEIRRFVEIHRTNDGKMDGQ